MNKGKLVQILSNYFCMDDTYTYALTRDKAAFEIGTMSLDDFVEWDDDNINDLAEYILNHCEVVRCRDCIHGRFKHPDMCECLYAANIDENGYHDLDFYCSYGE